MVTERSQAMTGAPSGVIQLPISLRFGSRILGTYHLGVSADFRLYQKSEISFPHKGSTSVYHMLGLGMDVRFAETRPTKHHASGGRKIKYLQRYGGTRHSFTTVCHRTRN